MALENSTSKAVFEGNGATTQFPFAFKVWDEKQIAVTVTNPNGVETPAAGWSVVLSANGGTVTYLHDKKPLPVGWKLAIARDMPFKQEDVFITGTKFDPAVIEEALDIACAERQELREKISRCVMVGIGSGAQPDNILGYIIGVRDEILNILQQTGDINGVTPITATGTSVARPIADRFADVVNVKDFGAKGDGVTDDTSAIIAAQKAGRAVYFPRGTYVCTDEILINNEGVSFIGEGCGYYRWHAVNPSFDVPCTRLLFKGTGKKSVKTRVTYRASEQDSNDTPISTAINIQADSFTLRDMTVELYCDYSEKSVSNLGDDWDVGIFHGSRVDLRIIDVNVVGYWREASIWLDSTRGVNLPELNDYTKTEGAGSDGISLVRVMTCGGKWGLRRLGPQPKDGLLHFGYQYKSGARLVFTDNPAVGDSLTIRGETFSFANTGTSSSVVAIGETVFDTANNLVSSWKSVTNRLIPYDELTLVATEQGVDVYSTSSSPTELSVTSSAIVVQTFDGASTTQTEAITDPAPYFDSVSGQSYDDGRDALGGSDFVADNCVFYSIEHHSGRAITSRTDGATAQNDTCGGAAWVDGLGGNALLHRQFFIHTRFHSREPYNVKLGFVGRARFVGCTHDGDPVQTYGRIVGDRDKTAIVQIFGYDDPGDNFPRGLNKNQIYSHFYIEGDNLYIRDEAVVGSKVTIGKNSTGGSTSYVNLVSGETGNAEVRFSSKAADTITRIRSSASGGMTFSVRPSGGGDLTNALFISGSSFVNYQTPRPSSDAALSLGSGEYRWSQLYAASGSINTSDANEKQDVQPYPDDVLDAWGDVKFRQFLFNDAVAAKGDAARIHAGIIAQQVVEAFAKYNLDATRYGLLCYDKWEDEYETVEVVDTPAELDADGGEVKPARTHTEQRLVMSAGDRYGIRYSEALCLEAAYQRRRAQRLEARADSLETRLAALEALTTNATSKYL